MSDERAFDHWSHSALVDELVALERSSVEVSIAVEGEIQPEHRVALLTHLSINSDKIDQIRAVLNERAAAPPVQPMTRSVEVTDDHYLAGDQSRKLPATSAPPRPRSTIDYSHLDGGRPASLSDRQRWLGILLGAALLVGLGTAAFVLLQPDDQGSETVGSESIVTDEGDRVAEVAAVVEAVGGPDITVELRGSTIFLSGPVATPELRDTVVAAAESVRGGTAVDSSELTIVSTESESEPEGAPVPVGQSVALQTEINRIVAATPIIFGVGQTEITELQQTVLNNVAATILSYPGIPISIVGFTDDVGSEDANRQLSLIRADGVRSYLVGKGVPENSLSTEAKGEEDALGSADFANFERRVEFKVAATEVVASTETLRIALVAPSDREDFAFTESMVDTIDVLVAERGNIEVAIGDNLFVPDEAAAAIRGYAEQGFDLVIAHGSQYGSIVSEVAGEYPSVAFAWGLGSDTFGLPNVYSYDVAAEEGGYVLGAMSAALSETGTIGVVGPIEIGEAARYINGFQAGARSEAPGTTVLTTYTGSFSDTTFARQAAEAHVLAGADVMSGTAQMVVGAVAVVIENDLLWVGTQSNQDALAPDRVVASQVYHWETIIRQITQDLDVGVVSGRSYLASLANGGLEIEYNPSVPLQASVRQRSDELVAAIIAGSITIPT